MANDNTADRLREIERKIGELDKESSVSTVLYEKNLEVTERLSNTIERIGTVLSQIKESLILVTRDVLDNTEKTKELGKKVDEILVSQKELEMIRASIESGDKANEIKIEKTTEKLDEMQKTFLKEIKELEDKIKAHDDAGKIDVASVLKNLILWLLSASGIGYIISLFK